MITEFSGDSSDNEQQLSVFLRGIFALAKTSDLSEKTTVNVIFRKLTGSAYFLTNQFINNEGPDVKMAQIGERVDGWMGGWVDERMGG